MIGFYLPLHFWVKSASLLACLSLAAGCAGLTAGGGGGLLRDPAEQTRAALATTVAETSTPLPSASPVPSPTTVAVSPAAPTGTSPAVSACASFDLLANERSDITGNLMIFTVELTNVGNHPCTLVQPPQVELLTSQGSPLAVQVTADCGDCIPRSAQQTPAPSGTPSGKAAAQPTSAPLVTTPGVLSLGSNQTVNLALHWSNWCSPFPPGGVALRLQLGSGNPLVIPTDAQISARCTSPAQPSALAVSPYFSTP